MKTWQLIYVMNGSQVEEHIKGDTKREARSVIVQRYKQQINFKSVKEIAA